MMFEVRHREEEVERQRIEVERLGAELERLGAELAQQRADAEAAAEDALRNIDSETEASTCAAEQGFSPNVSDQRHTMMGRQPGRLQAHPL